MPLCIQENCLVVYVQWLLMAPTAPRTDEPVQRTPFGEAHALNESSRRLMAQLCENGGENSYIGSRTQ